MKDINVLSKRGGRIFFLAALLISTLFSASASNAHMRVSPNRWYFGGSTYVLKDGKYKALNPINVIFSRGGTASLALVTQHLYDDWAGFFQSEMDNYDCADSGTQQYMAFRALDDGIPGQPSPWWDAQDEAWSTNPLCAKQWHVRGWDDYEHYLQTYGHLDLNSWVVANIHHEHRRWVFGGKHIVDVSWDDAAKKMRDRMDEHCSYLNWRWLPGSFRSDINSKYPSDGYVTLIMMRHVDAAGPCPKP